MAFQAAKALAGHLALVNATDVGLATPGKRPG
jgi:hypothetical protein